MAAPFPQLIPSQPSVVMPRHPHVAKRSTGGGESRIRLSNVRVGAQLTLPFENIDTSQLIQLLAHWRNARGTSREFQIGVANLGAMGAAGRALLLSTTWKYASPPTCEDICGGVAQRLLHTVKVELVSQPRRVAAYVNPTAPELSVPVTPTVISGGAFPARAALVGGLVSTAGGWNLPGAALGTGQVWVTAGRFSAGGGDLIGGALSATAGLIGGANTAGAASQPPSALGAGTSVSGGVFTLAGNMAGGALSAGATMTGGGLTIPPAWISLGADITAQASVNPGLAGGGPSGRAFSAGATMVGGLFAATQNGAQLNASASVARAVVISTPYTFARVALQIPGNGTNNSTSIVDVSSNALTITRSGSPVISTAASVYGGASVRFNAATTDALSINNPALGVTTEDFWMEGWFKFFSQDLGSAFFLNYNHDLTTFAGSSGSNRINISTVDNKLRFVFYAYPSAGEQYYTAADDVTITLTNFNHFAAGRVSGELAVWVNGVMYQMTIPFVGGNKNIGTRSIRSLGNNVHIGARLRETGSFDNGIDAYMDDFRFVKATPPWGLGNFTPSGPHPTS